MSTDLRSAILSGVSAFPAMPGNAASLLHILRDERSDAADIERLVRMDPGLTANVLKMANSAYFAGPRKIGSIRQAVMQIGWKRMVQIVVASAMNAILEGPVPGYDMPPGEMWRHSLASAVAAETIARAHRIVLPDELFTAAILHDIGKLVLGKYIEPFFMQLEMAMSEGTPFEQAEHAILGADHAEVGALILEKWQLPSSIVAAVRWHHSPDKATSDTLLVDLVHLADTACLLLGLGLGRDGIRYQASVGALTRIGIAGERLQEIAAEIRTQFAQVGGALEPQSSTP